MESTARSRSFRETQATPSERGRVTMRRKAQRVAKLVLLGLLLLAVAASAQDYKIRAKIDLVVVPVTVKGSGNKLITGLTQDDFTVFEDGRRQTITNFNNDPVPLSAAVVVDTG